MDRENFNRAINRLFFHFQAANPPHPDFVEIWFKKVQHIPEAALDFIVNRFENERDSIRCNITKVFKEYWQIWLDTHPDKKANSVEQTPCDDCNGTGIIKFWYFEDAFKRYYTTVVRCGRCQNWKRYFGPNTPIPIATKYQIEQNPKNIIYEIPRVREIAQRMGSLHRGNSARK